MPDPQIEQLINQFAAFASGHERTAVVYRPTYAMMAATNPTRPDDSAGLALQQINFRFRSANNGKRKTELIACDDGWYWILNNFPEFAAVSERRWRYRLRKLESLDLIVTAVFPRQKQPGVALYIRPNLPGQIYRFAVIQAILAGSSESPDSKSKPDFDRATLPNLVTLTGFFLRTDEPNLVGSPPQESQGNPTTAGRVLTYKETIEETRDSQSAREPADDLCLLLQRLGIPNDLACRSVERDRAYAQAAAAAYQSNWQPSGKHAGYLIRVLRDGLSGNPWPDLESRAGGDGGRTLQQMAEEEGRALARLQSEGHL